MTPTVVFLCVLSLFSCVSCFTVVSNKIYDPNGKEILIRGIDRPSFEWDPKGEQASLSDYKLMNGWGANVIRLCMNQNFWLSGASGYDSNYQATIDQQVQWIKSLGMGVILDLHWSNKGNLNNGAGQQVMADQYSNLFWQQVATKYKNDPWVIFELYNEPHDVSWSTWKDGGSDPGFQVYGMQQLLTTIRNAGANNAVIINGLNWAYDLSGVTNNAIQGSHIIYGTHPYNNDDKKQGSSNWDTYFGYLTANHPVIMTEFGQYCDNSQNYVQQLMRYCDQKGIHWTAWAWYPKDCGFPSIISDWNGTPSTPVGTLIKASLQATSTNTTKATTTASASTSTIAASTTGSKNATPAPGSSSGSTSTASSSSSTTSPSAQTNTAASSSGASTTSHASPSSTTTTAATPCNIGAEGCKCTDGGTCDKGLTCLSSLCVDYSGVRSNSAAVMRPASFTLTILAATSLVGVIMA